MTTPSIQRLTDIGVTGVVVLVQAFALAVALIGAIVIVRQTTTTERREEERRKRRAEALQAVLPLMLSELIGYAKRCADIFEAVLETGAGGRWPTYQRIPPLPTGFVGQLTDLIETIPTDQARPLVMLVKRVQIHHSRALLLQQSMLRPQPGEIVDRKNLLYRLIDAIEVHAGCERLFSYGRGDMPAAPAVISVDDLKRTAFFQVGRASLLEEVVAEIDHRAATEAPWPD